MKHFNQMKSFSFLSLAFLLSFAACSSVNNDVETISEADLEAAAEIVASSLSDAESGMMSSMYDALSNVDNTGISYGNEATPRFKGTDGAPDDHGRKEDYGRGGERSFTHEYDSTTGVHTITFIRSYEGELFSKSSTATRQYIYTDIDGNFVAEPRLYRDTIESISFEGTVSGSASSPQRSSEFTHQDEFEVAGLHESNSEVTMSGSHSGAGSMEGVTRDSVEFSKTFEVSYTFTNVVINKDTLAAYGNLENGVSGTLTYSVTMSNTVDGVPEETELEGTVDLSEDGTALMRFKEFTKIFEIDLKEGKHYDEGKAPRNGDQNRRG